ncbi:MAG: exosortase F system-associated membrane protein [Flavobacteriaceae bacterium]
MSKLHNYTLIGLLFGVLILIRAFESTFFYDPYIEFYKNHYDTNLINNINYIALFTHTALRYVLNTATSLGILYLAFNSKDVIKFAVVFYSIAFIILITLYFIISYNLTEGTYQLFFYIRRFLIQPIFVLVLLPAFYYQKKNPAK